MNFIFCLLQTGFLEATQAVKIKFKVDKKSSSSNWICQTRNFKIQVQINKGMCPYTMWHHLVKTQSPRKLLLLGVIVQLRQGSAYYYISPILQERQKVEGGARSKMRFSYLHCKLFKVHTFKRGFINVNFFWICCHLDTGHFFHTSLAQCTYFQAYFKIKNPKLGLFKGLRSFRGPQKQERKNYQNSIILGAKNKVRSNFI